MTNPKNYNVPAHGISQGLGLIYAQAMAGTLEEVQSALDSASTTDKDIIGPEIIKLLTTSPSTSFSSNRDEILNKMNQRIGSVLTLRGHAEYNLSPLSKEKKPLYDLLHDSADEEVDIPEKKAFEEMSSEERYQLVERVKKTMPERSWGEYLQNKVYSTGFKTKEEKIKEIDNAAHRLDREERREHSLFAQVSKYYTASITAMKQ